MSIVLDNFKIDVSKHTMEILKDDGLYRHLKFYKNGSSIYRFDIHTWPGHLCICGDMGCYVFARLLDMFEFFYRADQPEYINPGYWAEKAIAYDRTSSPYEFSLGVLKNNAVSSMRAYLGLADSDPLPEEAQILLQPILNSEDEYDAVAAVRECPSPAFDDFWEYTNKEESYLYTWCCHAIVWGIHKYKEQKCP